MAAALLPGGSADGLGLQSPSTNMQGPAMAEPDRQTSSTAAIVAVKVAILLSGSTCHEQAQKKCKP